MAEFSKIAQEAVVSSCKQMLHPWTDSCVLAALDMVQAGARGSSKFFMLMYSILLRLQQRKLKLNKAFFKQLLQSYLRSILFATTTAALFIISNCTLRKILGRFYYLTLSFVPAFIGGFAIFLENPNRRRLVINSYASMAFEVIERKLQYSKILTWTKNQETFVFMTINAFLMYFYTKAKADDSQSLWFYKPRKNSTCSEVNLKSLQQSFLKYFATGLCLQVLKILFSKATTAKCPKELLFEFLRFRTLSLGAFLGLYVVAYESIMRALQETRGYSTDYDCSIAGFCAGACYKIQPSISIFNTAIATLLEMLVNIGMDRQIIPVLPYSELSIFLWNAILYHARTVDAITCPRLMIRIMSSVTSKRSDWIYSYYAKISKAIQ